MLKVGLTGGIGSGKTTVSKIFEVLDIPVYYSDERAKVLMSLHVEVIEQIKTALGKNSYKDNQPDRKYIASIVFNDREKLKQLNSIIHPAVEKDYNDWCVQNREAVYTIKEAAILFETGIYKKLHKTILVHAPKKLRISRVASRDNLSSSEIESRMNNQWPTDKIMPLADYCINNDDKSLILPQILIIDKLLKEKWENLANGLEPDWVGP